MVAAFPFFSIPWTIKNRFIEICDASTLVNFIQINSWTREFSKKRIQSLNSFEAASKNDFINESNVREIKQSLNIEYEANLLLEDVYHIIPLYSKLRVNMKHIKTKVLKYLLGPNLKEFSLFTTLVYETIGEVKEIVDILLSKEFDILIISFHNHNPTEIQELEEAFTPLKNKYVNKPNIVFISMQTWELVE